MTQQVDRLEPSELDGDIEACRLLVDGDEADGTLSAGTLSAGTLPGGELEALRRRVESDQAAEGGPLARLRAMRTSRRVMLMLAVVAGVTVASVALTPRGDFAAYPSWHMGLSLAVLAAVASAASWRLLRPLHAPPPSVWGSRALLVAGVLLPALLAIVPLEHIGAAPGVGAAFAMGCGKCAAFGGTLGLPVLLLAFFARRSRVDGAAVAALGGVAAGVTGNLALQVHCPVTDPTHLLFGHVALVVLVGAAAAVWHR